MSRTLFWYLFKDLVRIFVLAGICLAGIMSFGGLLEPLTKQGLEGPQLAKVLFFFIPAMLTYSLPVAAIFATTIVYGRLSADNELTACRAAGISHLSIALPAIILGLAVSIGGILFLCFIVPSFTFRVEQTIYSNIAQIVAKQIERKHQIRFKSAGVTIFATDARVVPSGTNKRQMVILERPMIVTYEKATADNHDLRVPEEFWMARQADVYITRKSKMDRIMLEATLLDGTRFPRQFAGGTQGRIAATTFGPYMADSPVQEDPKFLGLSELKERWIHPDRNKEIRRQMEGFLQTDQARAFLESLRTSLGAAAGSAHLAPSDPGGDGLMITRDGPVQISFDRGELLLQSPGTHRYLTIRRIGPHGVNFSAAAAQLRIHARADNAAGTIDWIVRGSGAADLQDVPTPRPDFELTGTTPMAAAIAALANHPVDFYAHDTTLPPKARDEFRRDLIRLHNGVIAELNSRASFAVSCLILVIAGCALGMMFRSGNFLTAFALSVIPAILTIALIVTGQQIAANTHMASALPMGLGLIWLGNALVAVLASILMGRLQKS